eukprot:scaffold35750_cov56-Phaeocystis_antarctica.AAC.2
MAWVPARPKRRIGRGWPKLVGSMRHALTQRAASGEPAGRRRSHLGFDIVRHHECGTTRSPSGPGPRPSAAPSAHVGAAAASVRAAPRAGRGPGTTSAAGLAGCRQCACVQ